ncbi:MULTISPECIES: helix-turn-helix domain-containing protein [Roseobacteraceae]|uniref:Helix-turn-helix domain-containing protein n=1 Tax=Tropicimonas aquimaris TaxID=914152 RepID=A0ABW3IL13_9RHOB|nr:helix-turn-helix domain-containing protein [Aliiruegeria sabulilitoris]NDR56637.1 helix-turn-helix domain-containing protein [Pseudoruegeria sp. M32A2M]
MSHQATNWAILQRGLKPTTKIVLWHLCDRYNPDFGCFPSQERLAHDCEICRSTLNVHLEHLEMAGLLRRVPRTDPITKRQLTTRYILGFEDGFPVDNPDSCPDSGQGAVSDFCAEPCPENSESRVRNPDTNPVREPIRKPVKEAGRASAPVEISNEFFSALLEALGHDPAGALPDWWQGWPAREHVRRWRDDLGLTEEQILTIASATRRRHPIPPDGPKALDRAMERAAQHKGQPDGRKQSAASNEEIIGFYADWINSDRYLVPNSISASIRDALLARGLVTEDRLRERGVL